MESLEEIMDQDITNPRDSDTHSGHRSLRHLQHHHHHHHNGSVVVVNNQSGQLIQHQQQQQELNNNGALSLGDVNAMNMQI